MFLRKNKGSILIMSLITFSIISLFCVTCSGLILSNNRISDLEYKSEKLKEVMRYSTARRKLFDKE